MGQVDVLVIGAGQAGLAAGYYLKQSGRSFVLMDGTHRIGDSWRKRYDSLTLFSPRRYSGLPGLAMPGEPGGFPAKDEFADYLEAYASHFDLPVELGVHVKKLERTDAGYVAVTAEGQYTARHVIIATGPFQQPFIPELPGDAPATTIQLHSSQYRLPAQLPPGRAIIVGGGNSGAQIAAELAESRSVILATGHQLVFIPQYILGKSLFFWIGVLGISRISTDSRLSGRLKKGEPVIGTELKPFIDSGRVQVKKRAIAFRDGRMVFQDGSSAEAASIIWATGFRRDYSWLDVPGALNSECEPIHHRGISPIPGLYFLGLPWLSNVCSGRINGVGRDAKQLVRQITNPNRSI